MKRPAFWVLLGLVSLAATAAAVHYFPQAFSIVALDITMTRERALADARAIAARDRLGPADFRQAASFALDSADADVRRAGGRRQDRVHAHAARAALRGLHLARAPLQRRRDERDAHPLHARRPALRIRRDAEGRRAGRGARRRPRRGAAPKRSARARWSVDLAPFALVEQGQERRPGGRVDHTFTYERRRRRSTTAAIACGSWSPAIGSPRSRTSCGSPRRSRAATTACGRPTKRSASARVVGMVLLYVVGGIGVGLFFMLRSRYVLWRQAAIWGVVVGTLQALATLNEWPLMWMTYDTAVPRTTFIAGQIATLVATLVGFSAFMALSFMAAETLTRRAFGHHPQFWRVWAKGPGSSTPILRSDRRRLPARLGVLRLRRRALPDRDARRSAGGHRPRRCSIRTCSRPTCRGCRRSPTRSRPASGRSACSARCRSPAPRSSATASASAGCFIVDRVRRPGDHLRRGTRAVSDAAVVCAPGRAHHSVDRLRSALRLSSVCSPASSCTSRSTSSGSHCRSSWRRRPASGSSRRWSSCMTLVPLWVVLVAKTPGRRVDRAFCGRPQRRVDAAAGSRARRSRAGMVHQGLSPRTRSVWLVVGAVSIVACAARGNRRSRPDRHVHDQPDRGRETSPAVRSPREASTLGPQWRVLPVPDDGRGGAARVRVGDRRRREAARCCSACTCRSRAGTCASRPSKATWPSARKSGACFVTKAGQVLHNRAHAARSPAGRRPRRERRARSRSRAYWREEFGLDVGTRPGAGSLRASREAEGANRLDVHLRRHDARRRCPGRAADRRRARG